MAPGLVLVGEDPVGFHSVMGFCLEHGNTVVWASGAGAIARHCPEFSRLLCASVHGQPWACLALLPPVVLPTSICLPLGRLLLPPGS